MKKRSIFALEALSVNSSLWASIGSCLPSLSEALLSADGKDKDPNLETACLVTIQRVIRLPSNASAASASGISIPVCAMVWKNKALGKQALEVLHAMCQHKAARVGAGGSTTLINQGAVKAACHALTAFPKSDVLAGKALEILARVLEDEESYEAENSKAVVDAVEEESNIVRVLCASFGLTIAKEMDMDEDLFLNVYSKWKTTFSPSQKEDVRKVLFSFAAHFSSDSDNVFWTNFGYSDLESSGASNDSVVVVSTMCCDLLSTLDDGEDGSLVPEASGLAVKAMLLVGLAKCIKHGGVGLADVIAKYDLFVKAVNATIGDPTSPMIGELLESYPEVCTKTLLQTEDCLKAVGDMLRHGDAR